MRYFLIILFALAGFTGQCLAAGEQQPDSGDSATPAAEAATEVSAEKKQDGDRQSDKNNTADEEEEPDCE